ncbi:hypothetical protein LIER_30832 [Lithospermum erythrorhizon]|uniref:FAR1 domain-containing protein n=1 Tax=Lithospermum erythrorhizon TaxID=34254 RepID=A0AAV3RR05_LITER
MKELYGFLQGMEIMSIYIVCVSSDIHEVMATLVFAYENEAYEFYARYARTRGFGIRFGGCIKRTNKDSGSVYVHYVYLECHKQGVKNESKGVDVVVSHKRAEVRTGCQANMRLKIDKFLGGYVIYEWTDVHNHDLIDADKGGPHMILYFRHMVPIQI